MSKKIKRAPKTNQPTDAAECQDEHQHPKWWNPRWWLLVGVPLFSIFTATLFIATRYWVGHPNDTPAFVSGILTMLTLSAILVQILVTRRQWEAMRDGLKRTDTLIKQNKGIVKATKKQAEISSKTLRHSERVFGVTERAYIGLGKITVLCSSYRWQ